MHKLFQINLQFLIIGSVLPQLEILKLLRKGIFLEIKLSTKSGAYA